MKVMKEYPNRMRWGGTLNIACLTRLCPFLYSRWRNMNHLPLPLFSSDEKSILDISPVRYTCMISAITFR